MPPHGDLTRKVPGGLAAFERELAGGRTKWRRHRRAPLSENADPVPAGSVLDADTERTARAFLQRLEGRYPVQEGVLYGSRARRTHQADSDMDIAVVLQGCHGDRTAAALDMAAIAFDVMLETGVLVDALPLWQDELQQPNLFSNPALIQNIQREGVRLWARP